jgi:5-methyltetrahydrofolate--homocysteine methyltransferase
MNGLDTVNRLMDPEQRKRLEAELLEKQPSERPAAPAEAAAPADERRSSRISLDVPIPPVPDFERHVAEPDLDDVWSYVNPQMLYGKHLGFRGRFSESLEAGDVKAVELERKVEEVKAECRAGAMRVRALWQFFEAESEGNTLRVYSPDVSPLPVAEFTFPRQRKPDGLAISDLVLPPETDADGNVVKRDRIAMFVTTAGTGIRGLAEQAKERGEYLRSYALQALALETAEGAAEWVHERLRAAWGFPDEGLSRKDLFQARYRGKRYSFGYPACPDLEDQQILFDLLRPEEIGVELTEGYMMEPEASVSALIFHHPDATYFSAGASELEPAIVE